MKILIVFLVVLAVSGCSSINYVNIHKPAEIKPVCDFEKFTNEEKDSMIEKVGQKIFRNQQNCKITERENSARIKAHNAAHGEK